MSSRINHLPGLAVLTCGVSHSGINSAVRSVVRAAKSHYHVVGVQRGYEGLIDNSMSRMTSHDVSGKMGKPGSILECTVVEDDVFNASIDKMVENLKKRNLASMIVIGGRYSLLQSQAFVDKGLQVVGIPSTIQDDIAKTDISLGVDTAVNTIVQNIELIRSCGTSRNRAFIIQVDGQLSGNLCLRAANACGVELALTPENSCEDLSWILKKLENQNHRHFITLIAAGWKPGKDALIKYLDSHSHLTDMFVRETNLGWIQRGGSPTGYDRLLGSQFGNKAVEAISEGLNGVMVAIQENQPVYVPYSETIGMIKMASPELLNLMKLNE